MPLSTPRRLAFLWQMCRGLDDVLGEGPQSSYIRPFLSTLKNAVDIAGGEKLSG